MIEQMWQVLTTLSEEAQKAALTRCAELGFDVNRGPVSLPPTSREVYCQAGRSATRSKSDVYAEDPEQTPLRAQALANMTPALLGVFEHLTHVDAPHEELVARAPKLDDEAVRVAEQLGLPARAAARA